MSTNTCLFLQIVVPSGALCMRGTAWEWSTDWQSCPFAWKPASTCQLKGSWRALANPGRNIKEPALSILGLQCNGNSLGFLVCLQPEQTPSEWSWCCAHIGSGHFTWKTLLMQEKPTDTIPPPTTSSSKKNRNVFNLQFQ